MAYLTSAHSRAIAARHARLARLVASRLASAGIPCEVHDMRDVHGTRLDPVNLVVCGTIRVLVRPAGWRPGSGSSESALIAAGSAWAQCGASASDVAPLIARLMPLVRDPWALCPQSGRPLVLKQ